MPTRKRTGFQVKASTRFEEEGEEQSQDEASPIETAECIESVPLEVVISEDSQPTSPPVAVVEKAIPVPQPVIKPVPVNQPEPPRRHRNTPRFSRSKGI